MGSLSALFALSRAALTADQAALNATSSNVANQNSVGYTRQVVSISGADTVALSANSATAVTPRAQTTSARDRILEHRVQQQTQMAAETSARADALSAIEGVFSLSGSSATAGSTQIGTDLDGLFSSLQALQANSTDWATQQGVLSAAAALASDFNAASAELTQVKAGLSAGIASTVPQVNALTASIASLNGQISSLSPKADAGALEDQRQSAIAQLSALVGLDQITTESNGITLTTRGGTVLVEGQHAYALKAGSGSGGTTVLDSSGLDVSAGTTGGSLGGKLMAQNIDVPMVSQGLDALAHQIATAVNAQNAAGLTTSGATGGALFTIPGATAGSAAAISLAAGATVAPVAPGEGSSGNGNATALAGLVNTVGAAGLTMSGALGALVGMIGTNSAALKVETASQQATLTQLTTHRDSISGVSLDEEAANLSQYEKSYQAAAKLLAVLDKLMAAAINIGTPTAAN